MHVKECKESKTISYIEGMYTTQLEYDTEDQLACIRNGLSHCRSIQEVISLSTDIHKMCTLSGFGIDWQEVDIRLENAYELHCALGIFGSTYFHSVITPLHNRYAAGERTDDLYYKILSMTPGV